MTFSTRNAILSDDEEWFNIPPVVRNFLRQLNNEVHGNRLSLDNLLTNYQEQDNVIKSGLSKQMERDVEMNKTILVLQQDREEGESSLRDVVENFREQLRRFSEDQRDIRDRLRQIEEKECERTTKNESLRSNFVSLSKTMNQRLGEVETYSRNSTDNLTRIVEKLDSETQLQFQKHDSVFVDSRADIERFNQALHQLCDAVSEDVDNLRMRLQDHEGSLQEIKELCDRKNETQANIISRMREKLKETEGVVRHLESSSDDRFESVFGTLEKSQSLIDKLSKAYEKQTEGHSSILKLLNETRHVHTTLSEEVLASFEEKLKKQDTQLDTLHRNFTELHSTHDVIEERFKENCSVVRSDFEDIYSHLEKVDSKLSSTVLKEDLKESFSEMFSYEKTLIEKAQTDLHHSIKHDHNIISEEVECLKKTFSNMGTKFEEIQCRAEKSETASDLTRVALKKQEEFKKALKSVQEEIREMRDIVTQRLAESLEKSKNNASGPVAMMVKIEVEELKASLDRAQHMLDSQGVQLNEMQQKVIHHDALVKDIPKCVQIYLQDVDDKLSPTFLELDVLRKRITSLEVRGFPTHSQETGTTPGNTGDDLEDVKVRVMNNHLLHSTQRQLQSTEVRLDNLHALNQSLERKIDLFSKELSDVTEVLTSLDERENQKDLLMRNEVNRVTTQVSKLEDEVKKLLGDFVLKEKSPTKAPDIKNFETSLEAIWARVRELEERLFTCVKFSSVEWIELRQEIGTHEKRFQEGILSGGTLQTNKSLDLAPLSRVLANEETMNLIKKEVDQLQDALKSCNKIMESNKETLSESRAVSSFEQRLCLLESSRVDSAEPVFLSRVTSMEKALGETQAKVSTLYMMSESVELCNSRLSEVEKKIQEDNCGHSLSKAFPVLLDRLAGVEGAIGTLSRDTEKILVDLLSYQQRIQHIEEQNGDDKVNNAEISNSRVEETVESDETKNTIAKAQERLKEVESHISSLRNSISEELQSFYTKTQMDARIENIWASFIGLLTRKGDQETIDQRLSEIRQLVKDDVSIRINGVVRDMQRAIDERVKVSEVRELLRGT